MFQITKLYTLRGSDQKRMLLTVRRGFESRRGAPWYIRMTEEGYKFNTVWSDSPQTLDRLNKAMTSLSALYAPAVCKLYDKMLKLFLQNRRQTRK